MAMPKNAKIERGYATVTDDDGDSYREIAEQMTARGHAMNHASARNYILRGMRKFAHALVGRRMTDTELDELAKNPVFQSTIAELVTKALSPEAS